MLGKSVIVCPLPTYPFEKQRYWVEERRTKPVATGMLGKLTKSR